jgi:hypothetical protein
MTDTEIAERRGFCQPDCPDGWCHAGGVLNFREVGIECDHPNYGFPHVVLAEQTACVYYGKEILLTRG